MSESITPGARGPIDEKHAYAAQLRANLARAKVLRQSANSDPRDAYDRLRLREWQASRLARTHADLLASPRFGPAAAFFLSDLYGPKDFSERDHEVERIVPTLIALLPAAAICTISQAIEVDALSEELDAAMVEELRRAGAIGCITGPAYAEAYRRCDNHELRERQIMLIREVGESLDRLTRKPLVGAALRMMRAPAQLAGLGELHAFLDLGYSTFRRMGSAEEFLRIIVERETRLMNDIWKGRNVGIE